MPCLFNTSKATSGLPLPPEHNPGPPTAEMEGSSSLYWRCQTRWSRWTCTSNDRAAARNRHNYHNLCEVDMNPFQGLRFLIFFVQPKCSTCLTYRLKNQLLDVQLLKKQNTYQKYDRKKIGNVDWFDSISFPARVSQISRGMHHRLRTSSGTGNTPKTWQTNHYIQQETVQKSFGGSMSNRYNFTLVCQMPKNWIPKNC